ncbi:MAG: response regulator [Candidatus Tectomicrobia bacterium]|uniref:histidine kinase n=1 Tax=Tectimicrobiota bacterium TaxID=2528274 RepID=A0A932LZX5_UNCTE|nr:response regulator [Candidatus Tectomicrobia bacterium]
MKVAIVGLGEAGAELLKNLARHQAVHLVSAVESSPLAPGVALARSLRIPITADLDSLLSRKGIDLYVETSGSREAFESLRQKAGPDVEVLGPVGTKMFLKLLGRESGSALTSLEASEEGHLREQLMQSEKLAAMGQIMAGLAHELNNPLTSIIGYCELALERMRTGKHKDYVSKVLQEADRAAKIVQHLVAFARKHKPEKEVVNLNELLDATLALQDYSLRVSGIQVLRELDPDLPMTTVDAHQLQQVFLNLLINAEQAIRDSGKGGIIRIRSFAAKDGARAVIEITDDGPGVPMENQQKLFEPFFTTKEVGRGTGLGLSISQGIVRSHGGHIYVRSKSGAGATFGVDLPAASQETSPRVRGKGRVEKREGGGDILIVDDEETVLEVMVEILQADGYRPDVATDGQRALDMVLAKPYDLMITDVRMPGMDGPRIHQELLARDPELARRCLFTTGDTLNPEVRKFFQRTGCPYLHKPFSSKDLRGAVRRALRGEGGPC